jgi:hypothetical protein
MPFMMLAKPHLEQAAIKRIRETWERCTDGEEFVNPPWDDVIQKVGLAQQRYAKSHRILATAGA